MLAVSTPVVPPDRGLHGNGHVWQVSNFSGSRSLITIVVTQPTRLLLAVGAVPWLSRRCPR